MWPSTRLTKLLRIEHPIIQAPMAGASTPAMAAAVANAGGLGSIGAAMMTAETLRKTAEETSALTNRPVNFNFFAHEEPDLAAYDDAPMRAALKPFYEELGLGDVPQPSVPAPAFNDEMLEVLLASSPKVVSFHFGLPAPHAIEALKARGTILIGNATSVAEAVALEKGGMDAIIAQGMEAGGHRGTFLTAGNDMGTLALVPQIVDAVTLPVIAAGGIADGRGIAAAFMLGADGAQLGTAFLRSPESAIPAPHKKALAERADNETRVTRLFSGRHARALKNRLTEELAAFEKDAAPFPAQRPLSGPLAKAALAKGSGDFHSLWSGQAGPMAQEEPSAAIFEHLCGEALRRLTAQP